MLIVYAFYKIVKESISESVEKELQKPIDTNKKSRFQQRLEEIQKLHNK